MQQINLYLLEFQPNREPLRAVHMLLAACLLLMLLVGYSIYTHAQLKKLVQQEAQAQTAFAEMNNTLKLLSAKKPVADNPELDVKIAQLHIALQRRQQVLQLISRHALGNDKGFSEQVMAFGRAALSGLSLESFSLERGGEYAEFSGVTRSADQVPLYVQRLKTEKSFAEVGMGVMNIERDTSQSSLLHFSFKKPEENSKGAGIGRAP